MKKICKELIAICLLIIIFCSAFPLKGVQAVNTSGSFEQRILQLQQKFPAGKYWNHMGSSVNNPDGYTNIPCTHHGNCSKNGYGGWCGCNSFNGQSIQCFGFAEKLGYDVFGTNPRTSWIKYNSLSNVRPGDIIRYKNNGHSIFVTNVVGDTITFADCNSDNHCKIRWNATINKANIVNFNYVKHANNYDDVISVPVKGNYAPEGSADSAVGGTGSVTVSGWAFDRDDVSKAVTIHVYIGGPTGSGAPVYGITANKERTDVGNAYGTGNYHGYYETITTDLFGTQTLYFYAIGIGEGGNTFLGTKTVTIKKSPVGVVDTVEGGIRKIKVRGWAYDPESPDSSIDVHVYVGGPVGSGAPGYPFNANQSRPDVGNAYGVGNNHGFSGTIETDLSGKQTLYFYALDAKGQGSVCFGTKTVNISESQSPIGIVDLAEGGTDSIKVAGWAYDPDNQGQTTNIHIYAGGPAGTGKILTGIRADKERKDVGTSGVGDYHGFSEEIATDLTGKQTLYFYAIDTNGNAHSMIGTKEVTIRQGKSPIGHLDSIQGGEGNILVRGWTIDEDVPTQTVPVHVYIGGPAGSGVTCNEIMANEERADLKDVSEGAGIKHGFAKTITTSKRGEQEVYIYAIDRGSRQEHTCLGHGTVTIRDPQPVQEHVHYYQEETVRATTCTMEGEKQYICSCGDSYTEKIEKIPHTVVTDEAQPATCTESGKTEGSHCSVCGMVVKVQEIVEKTGHRHTVVKYAREATCMSAGYTGDTFCADCGMKVAEGTETELLAHVWDSGVTMTEPTATEDGICVFTCTECGTTRIKKLPVTMAPTETPPAKPSQGATPVQVSTPPPIIVTEKPQTEIPKNTETPQITIRPIDTEIPTKTVQPETTLVVPTSTPVIDEDFSGDLITEISLYSDLDEGEQLRVGDSFTIYTDVYPVIFEDTELQWLSSDKKIATVNKKGDVQCVGVGTVMITAMATDGSGKSASMTFKVEKAISNDNNLSSIKFSQGKLTPAFKKNKKSYSLVLSKNMSKVVIKVKKSDSAATVKINGKAIEKITVKLKRGQTKKITIRVIAENGKGKTYQIKVKRKK